MQRLLRLGTFSFISILSFAAAPSRSENWLSTLTPPTPGTFPLPRPLRATYRFAWSGFTAGTADVSWARLSENRIALSGTGQSVGLARALWRFDVKHKALADATTLRPIEVTQLETLRAKKISTELTFDANGVSRKRSEGRELTTAVKPKRFDLPNLLDLHSSLLFVRSRPLENRSVTRVAVYPANSAYVATVTVLGREKVAVRAGSFKAIKLGIDLRHIGKNRELEPHRKFRRAVAWISDDNDRVLLRIEAQIFIGTVSAELQSLRFEETKAPAAN